MKNSNLISSILVMAISVFFFYQTFSFPNLAVQDTGPALMPRIYCGILMILGILLLVDGIRKKEESVKGNFTMIYVVMGFVFIYLFMIPILGFYIMTLLFVLTFLWVTKVRKLVTFISVPVGTVLFVYLFFQKMLKVPIPLGPFFS